MVKTWRSAENVCNYGKSVKFVRISHYSVSAHAWKTPITTDSGRMEVRDVQLGKQSIVLFKKDKTMLDPKIFVHLKRIR